MARTMTVVCEAIVSTTAGIDEIVVEVEAAASTVGPNGKICGIKIGGHR